MLALSNISTHSLRSSWPWHRGRGYSGKEGSRSSLHKAPSGPFWVPLVVIPLLTVTSACTWSNETF